MHIVFVLLLSLPVAAPASAGEDAPPLKVTSLMLDMRFASGMTEAQLEAAAPLEVEVGAERRGLPPGQWRAVLSDARPATQRYHVFSKTFQPNETAERDAYVEEWMRQGFEPEVRIFYRRLETDEGRIIDNRQYWVSLARCASESEAELTRKRLEALDVWAWVRPETIAHGAGTVALQNAKGETVLRLPIPVTLSSSAPLAVQGVDKGFWKQSLADFTYPPPLRLEVGPEGTLEVRGRVPIETYLQGVLPAEMAASWPQEALRAQAVAARSEVLASLAGKHFLEGFDFCALEHCRAYKGLAGHEANTNAALAATAAEVLVAEGEVVPTVFAATCGGWTEHNENVWSGPLNPMLRGIGDFPGAGKSSSPAARGIEQWLTKPPPAYCAADTNYFRWTRRLTTAEITASVNKYCNVGTVRRIQCGERGESGRLKSVTITGSRGVETIRKELNIRLAFGGLPSAMFAVSPSGSASAPTAFVFRGGGRGHGVGLCQYGARGMASAGMSYREILKHYFTGIQIERLQ